MIAAHINDQNKIQPVEEHCKNVSRYGSMQAKFSGLEHTVELAGLLHDIGKNTQVFDEYIRRSHEDPRYGHRGEINHSSAGARVLQDLFGESKTSSEKLALQMISYAIISHHGLNDCLNPDGTYKYGVRIHPEREIYYQEAVRNSQELLDKNRLQECFQQSVEEIRAMVQKINQAMKNEGEIKQKQHFMMGCLQRMILSFLVDADRTDTAAFMSGKDLDTVARKNPLPLWIQYQDALNKKLKNFPSNRSIDELRSQMSDYCHAFGKSHRDGVYRLSIPTGGGKTLASLRMSLEIAKRTGKQHIIYCAPYLSILEQNALEIKSIFQDEEHVLEHHSNIIMEDEAEEDAMSRHEMLEESWESPVILTTMVQLLNTMFSGKMASVRRMHQLKHSVIIFDEAQSIPIKLVYMFNMMVNFLVHCCHTTVILCTATQPLLDQVKYGLCLSDHGEVIPNLSTYEEAFRRTTILPCIESTMSAEELADFILDKMDRNILVILNTKRAVQKLYDVIAKKTEGTGMLLFQLTTYMCAAHRIDRIAEIKNRLNGMNEKIICISTQLIEAGVDISFERVVRSLSGLDSVAQAAGRCNRHGERRTGEVYLVDFQEENTDRMPDIRIAQDTTRLILHRGLDDLLSRRSMNLYYEQYFFNREKEMAFFDRKHDWRVFELLAQNRAARSGYQSMSGEAYPQILAQSFQTAGKCFEVIDDQDTFEIVVPYQESIEYIQKIKQTENFSLIKSYLKKLQRYTISLHKMDRMVEILKKRNALDFSEMNGKIAILDVLYYGENGITDELKNLLI